MFLPFFTFFSWHNNCYTSLTGQRGGHCDDGDDQAVEERGAEAPGLEAAAADTRRGHLGGSQGVTRRGAPLLSFQYGLLVFLLMYIRARCRCITLSPLLRLVLIMQLVGLCLLIVFPIFVSSTAIVHAVIFSH